MDSESLLRQIADAFPAESAPKEIVGHQCDECARVQHDLEGRSWTHVALETLRYHHDSLPLLTPKAYAYFIPAFLAAAVRDPLGQIAPMVLYSLQKSARRQECSFTDEQRRMLLQAAEWLAAHESYGVDMDRVRKAWS